MVEFRLNHFCNRAGCSGEPGQVIQISEEQALHLEDLGGGRRVETATDAVAETAERPRRKKRQVADDSVAAEAETREEA